ncbi:MAG: DUF1080 domain-containing protein [Pirellulaceae bacterium]|nr:DUF1080 domain-containing protein [Pirellulaceae bacterium]
MKCRMMVLVICLTCLLGTPVKSQESKSLFDGKSLQGWEGNPEMFRVQDGAIVAGTLKQPIPQNEFLCTKQTFGDFELRLKVKALGDGVNAGIQFRTRRIPNHHEVIGYQADVGGMWWGKLYDESRRRKTLAGPADTVDMKQVVRRGDWNEYVVRCEGPRVQMWLNGTQTVDYVEPDGKIARQGVIAVQIHGGPPSEAWYKDIRISPLNP